MSFLKGNRRLELIDVYVFGKLGEPGKSILVMNVHTSDGVNPAGLRTAAPGAVYEFKIDTNGYAIADIAYRTPFHL